MGENKKKDHVVITVLGMDKVGIVARTTALLARCNVNIVDISQTLMNDLFTMMMVVDMAGAAVDLETLQKRLTALGGRIGVQILVQHERIFRYMHRV